MEKGRSGSPPRLAAMISAVYLKQASAAIFVPRRRITRTRPEPTGFADPRPQAIDYRWNRIMRNPADEKNGECRFAGSVGAGTDAYPLHAGLLHQFIRARRMHDFRARHFRVRDGIDEPRAQRTPQASRSPRRKPHRAARRNPPRQ